MWPLSLLGPVLTLAVVYWCARLRARSLDVRSIRMHHDHSAGLIPDPMQVIVGMTPTGDACAYGTLLGIPSARSGVSATVQQQPRSTTSSRWSMVGRGSMSATCSPHAGRVTGARPQQISDGPSVERRTSPDDPHTQTIHRARRALRMQPARNDAGREGT
jgi:hypothetical protein